MRDMVLNKSLTGNSKGLRVPKGSAPFFMKECGLMLKEKAKVMNEQDMERALKRMSHEILEKNRGLEDMILVGIQRRGVYLANRLRDIFTDWNP